MTRGHRFRGVPAVVLCLGAGTALAILVPGAGAGADRSNATCQLPSVTQLAREHADDHADWRRTISRCLPGVIVAPAPPRGESSHPVAHPRRATEHPHARPQHTHPRHPRAHTHTRTPDPRPTDSTIPKPRPTETVTITPSPTESQTVPGESSGHSSGHPTPSRPDRESSTATRPPSYRTSAEPSLTERIIVIPSVSDTRSQPGLPGGHGTGNSGSPPAGSHRRRPRLLRHRRQQRQDRDRSRASRDRRTRR